MGQNDLDSLKEEYDNTPNSKLYDTNFDVAAAAANFGEERNDFRRNLNPINTQKRDSDGMLS